MSLSPEARPGSGEASPEVRSLSWGTVEVEGGGRFKDVKLFPGGARAWDWRETGTAHEPGIQPADIDELLDRGATTVVLSRGMLGRLGVPAETLAWLEARGVRAHVAQTEEAVRLYNELRARERVGALLHSTC